MSALPSQVNYNEPLLRLPENTTNFLAAALPTNGSSFGPGSIAQVDLQQEPPPQEEQQPQPIEESQEEKELKI